MKCQKNASFPLLSFPRTRKRNNLETGNVRRKTIVLLSLPVLSRFRVRSDWIFFLFCVFRETSGHRGSFFSYPYAKWEEANFGTYESVNFSDKAFSHALTIYSIHIYAKMRQACFASKKWTMQCNPLRLRMAKKALPWNTPTQWHNQPRRRSRNASFPQKIQIWYYLAISFGRVLFEDRPHPLQGYPPVLLSCRAAQVKHQPQVVHVSLYFEEGEPLCAHLGKKDSPFHSLSPLICSSPRTFFVRKCAPPFCSHYSYAKKAISRIIFGVGKKEGGDWGASVSFHFIPAVESEMTERFSFYSSFLCPPLPLSP